MTVQFYDTSIIWLQAWAVVSGKITEHPNDKAKWKTNFRSALNSLCRRFKMVEDHSKDSNDPHKVYLVINECKITMACVT